jgi:quercetin dioxygenase-like cupin family protein
MNRKRRLNMRIMLLLVLPTLVLWGGLAGQESQEDYRFRPESEYQKLGEKTTYQRFLEEENIPVYKGWSANMYTVEVKPWKRHGEGISGAYADLEGVGGSVDNWVMEIAPGAQTKAIRHLYDENIIILSGEGETHIWREAAPEKKAVIHWRKGTVFAPPLNTWHQHFNKGSEPARLSAETTLPIVLDIFRNREFIFNNPFDFADRYASEPDYFDPENRVDYGPTPDHHSLSLVNLVRNAWTLRLFNAGQGYKDIDRHFNLSGSSMPSHVEQFPVGTYERAHRHNAGATIILLTGTGYTLLWPQTAGETPWKNGNADQVHRTDWGPGVLFVPPTQWYHQHFNNGEDPARFIRLGGPPGNESFPVGAEGLTTGSNTQIPFAEEDHYVRELFEKELAANGAKINMPSREELIKLEKDAGGKFIVLSPEELSSND